MMLKRILSLLIVLLLCFSMFAGCKKHNNSMCEHNWELISQSNYEYKCSKCKETHLCGNPEDFEKVGNLNESTLIYKCKICGSEHLTTDPDSIDKPSDQQVAAPDDFDIHFETWIDGSQRNILDTYEGYIQKDLISDGVSKKDYNPSYVELCQLYQFVLALEHRTELDYSKPVTYDNYADEEISVSMDPLTCYYLKFTANGKTIEISGDATANECTDQSEEALFFVDAIRGIGNFYRNTDVYKTMPNANGGYE